jgi:hypothetical protein
MFGPQLRRVGAVGRRTIPFSLLLVISFASSTFAGNGINGVFNLGVTNTVNATTKLFGSVAAVQLTIANASTAAAAGGISASSKGVKGATARFTNSAGGPALKLNVQSGATPMLVNAGAAKVQNLDADKLDGVDSSGFVRPAVPVTTSIPAGGSFAAAVKVENSSSANGIALYGIASATSGAGIGVAGNAYSASGYAVYGSGVNGATGVRGEATTGKGVSGYSATGTAGVFGQADAAGASGVEGVANGGGSSAGVYGHSTNAPGVWGRNFTGIAVKAEGNTSQSAANYGWAKAMVRFQGDGTFVDCFNGVSGVYSTSAAACGFGFASAGGALYNIQTPGLSIQYRFVALSGSSTIVVFGFPAVDTLQVGVGNATSGYAYYVVIF